MVDPVSEVKYPFVVDKVGTWREENTLSDD
jgi:hypothetical protein